MNRTLRIALFALLAVVLIALYLYGANVQLRTNTDHDAVDQGAYINYAKNLHRSHYTYIGGRARMPLYPLLLSVLYVHDPGATEQKIFRGGKWLGVALSLFVLAAILPIFRRYFPWHQSLNLLLILAFGVFVFRAAWVQCELLFYLLNLVAFWLASRLLVRPGWKLGIVAGAAFALAYLTKASVLPGLALFLFCVALRAITALCGAARARSLKYLHDQGFCSAALSALVCLLFFLGVIFPYIHNSKRIYGHYFYNVSSTFYMWYDSWDEVARGTRAFGDREGWPRMPADQIPSMQKYLREHTPQQMLEREWHGLKIMIQAHTHESYGYVKYVMLYLLIALATCMLTGRSALAMVRKYPLVFVFWVAWPLMHIALYAWFAPVSNARRFLLAQFMPFMFTAAYAIHRQGAELPPLLLRGRRAQVSDLFSVFLSLLVIVDIYWSLTYRLATVWGGN